MNTKIILLICVVGCIGCSQMVWYQESKSFEELQQDFRECKYDAVKYGYVPIQYNAYSAPGASGAAAGIEQAFREMNIISECMKSKGYRLVPKSYIEKMGGKIEKLE